jgi:hypothetical protein
VAQILQEPDDDDDNGSEIPFEGVVGPDELSSALQDDV